MSGAELKVQLTGLGLSPIWLADELGISKRTVLRYYDRDAVPAEVVAEIDRVSRLTLDEMSRVIYAMENGVVLTQRTGVAKRNTAERNALPASWHRALTFRALEHVRSQGVDASVAFSA
jgi:hypothetical protein